MHKAVDYSFLSLNACFGFMQTDWNINIISAIAGLLWVLIVRLPKAIYYVNKAWLGLKATWKGEKLDEKDYLENKIDDES